MVIIFQISQQTTDVIIKFVKSNYDRLIDIDQSIDSLIHSTDNEKVC